MEYLQIIIVVLLVIVLMFLVWLITKVNNLHKQVQEYTDDVDAKNKILINAIEIYFAGCIDSINSRLDTHVRKILKLSKDINIIKINSKAKNSYNNTKQGSKPKRQTKSKKQPKTANNKDI